MKVSRGNWIALLLMLGLIAYGSLYPFNFRADLDVAERLSRLVREPPGWKSSWGDTLGNVALFVPLGFLSAVVFKRSTSWTAFGFAVFVLGFAAGLQALQAFVPSRLPAAADVLWNAIGFGTGLLGGWLGDRWVSSRRARLDRWDRAALGVGLLWVAGELLPFVPSLDWAGFRAAVKPLVYSPHADPAAIIAAAAQAVLLAWIIEDRLGPPRAAVVIPTLFAGIFALRLVCVGSLITAAVPAAYLLAYFLWRLSGFLPRQVQILSVLGLALAAYTISQLAPFELRSSPEAISWVPFASMLKGSMLVNTGALLTTTFAVGAFLFVAYRAGASLRAMAIVLAIWVGVLEAMQVWVVGRSADVTPILLTFAAAAAIGWLVPRPAARPIDTGATLAAELAERAASRPRPLSTQVSQRFRAIAATVTAAFIIAGGIWLTLRLPGIPYNLVELFHWDARLPVLLIFALATLWAGAGACWGSRVLARSDKPGRLLPALTILAALVSLALLYVSVTEESVGDISGSNNLYWFVTNKDIWGEPARQLFLLIGSPAIIAFFERPARYAALYGPVFVFPAVMLACGERLRLDKRRASWYVSTMASALMVLWLCKAIAFDWSSTDNLTELIARDGRWGLGGGGYLYALLGLIVATALVLSARLSSRADPVGRIALMLLAIPVGWWLLSEGLGARIEKYEHVFSGAQFLLGPDRKQPLDDSTLFGRWAAVQSAGVAVIAAGIVLGNLWRDALSPPTDRSVPAKRASEEGLEGSPLVRNGDGLTDQTRQRSSSTRHDRILVLRHGRHDG